jgi:hypothetical protein
LACSPICSPLGAENTVQGRPAGRSRQDGIRGARWVPPRIRRFCGSLVPWAPARRLPTPSAPPTQWPLQQSLPSGGTHESTQRAF